MKFGREEYYSKDGKTSAVILCADKNSSLAYSASFMVYYEDGHQEFEGHKITLYEWAKHMHGNAPSGTPYGYFRATRNGKRIILTV